MLTRENVALLELDALGGPGPLDLVVVLLIVRPRNLFSKTGSVRADLVVRDGDGLVNDVADGLDLGLEQLLLLGSGGEQLLLLLLQVG